MMREASPEERMLSWALQICWRRSLAEEPAGKQSVGEEHGVCESG